MVIFWWLPKNGPMSRKTEAFFYHQELRFSRDGMWCCLKEKALGWLWSEWSHVYGGFLQILTWGFNYNKLRITGKKKHLSNNALSPKIQGSARHQLTIMQFNWRVRSIDQVASGGRTFINHSKVNEATARKSLKSKPHQGHNQCIHQPITYHLTHFFWAMHGQPWMPGQ